LTTANSSIHSNRLSYLHQPYATMFSSVAFRATRLPTTTSLSARAFSSTALASAARMSIVGRLAAAPEEFTTANDRTLVRYALGTSYGKPENRKTSWFKITAFSEGAQKDFLLNLPKG
jgi:Single-strand binding protein family